MAEGREKSRKAHAQLTRAAMEPEKVYPRGTFDRLPPEIRRMIFDLYIHDLSILVQPGHMKEHNKWGAALFRTSKAIREDCKQAMGPFWCELDFFMGLFKFEVFTERYRPYGWPMSVGLDKDVAVLTQTPFLNKRLWLRLLPLDHLGSVRTLNINFGLNDPLCFWESRQEPVDIGKIVRAMTGLRILKFAMHPDPFGELEMHRKCSLLKLVALPFLRASSLQTVVLINGWSIRHASRIDLAPCVNALKECLVEVGIKPQMEKTEGSIERGKVPSWWELRESGGC